MKSRIVKDLCGNEYYIEEAEDLQGKFLEVYEIVKINNTKMKTYLCDIGIDFNSDDNDILDEIDDMRDKIIKDE